jgi:hypothetical protein
MKPEPEDDQPNWLDDWFEEFSRMADRRLGEGSSCAQIHPVIERWFLGWLQKDMGPMRGSVAQALACLSTEVLNIAPKPVLDALLEHCDEDEVARWIQHVLATGKAFQAALDSGELDDL